MPNNFEDAVLEVMKEQLALMVRKQRDYGHGNILDFGEFGVIVRMNDKMARLKNLFRRKSVPQNESVEDTYRDLCNYAIIALMLRRGTFTLPLAEDTPNEKNT